MPGLSPDQIREIRGKLLETIDKLNDLLLEKGDELSSDQIKDINRATRQLNNAIIELTARAIQGMAKELQEAADGIKDATDKANDALNTLEDIKDAINIITSIIGLGTAIASGNPVGITNAANGLLTAVTQATNSPKI